MAQNGESEPVPAENPGTWVTTNDYPSPSLRLGEEGVTGFRLSVDKEGRVTDCEVTSSSGSTLLDEQTCTALRIRARFQPGRNASGEATASSYSSSVRWEIPNGGVPFIQPTPVDSYFEYVIAIDAEGAVTDCQIRRAEENGEPLPVGGPVTPCIEVQARGVAFEPFRNAEGEAVPGRVRFVSRIVVEEPMDSGN